MPVGDKLTEAGNGDNLAIWNSNNDTDKAFVQKMQHGAKLTTIDATYQCRRATSLWGPYGKTWGLRDLYFGYVGPDDQPMEMWLEATFWYPGGEFPISVDWRWERGKDTRIKLVTHAWKKALGMLGFSEDVYLGSFDSEKYLDQAEDVKDLAERIMKSLREAPDAETLHKYMDAAKGRSINRYWMQKIQDVFDECQRTVDPTTEQQAEEVFG